ncbi:MAG: hypothetical protein A3I73_00870 [Omnitrophica bacterium RIFCSPLOWO2_02_FULL_45_16]|nr:MAG: hypothetical protein A3C51_04300 [Omnitrophica bacterium RIFCSPHIGHO2_02_FULL_46_20]OGX00757.1 MAG: hypothetical protein A3I73_00870 [Omnitrophica bacterium RIFCSPLOWO2_02_FULL_45_16]
MDKGKQRKKGERYHEYRYCCNDCKATLEHHTGEYCTKCGSKNIDMIESIDCVYNISDRAYSSSGG